MTETLLSTQHEIANDFIKNLWDDDRLHLKQIVQRHNSNALSRDDIHCINEMCRFIRNNYSLWHNSPLTYNWRNDIDRKYAIMNGVEIDVSEDHPDQISENIKNLIFGIFENAI